MLLADRRHRRGLLSLALAIASFAFGCTHSVTIVRPLDGTFKDPITTMTVKFDKDFQPGTFQASLSGTTITNLFQPTPVPGGTSSAAVTYAPNFMDFDYNGNKQHLVVDGEFTTPTSGLGNRMTRDSS